MIGGIVAAVIVLVLAFLLFIPVGIGIKYEKDVFVILKIAFWKINIEPNFVLNRKKNKSDGESAPDKKLDNEIQSIDFVLNLIGDLREFVRKKLRLKEFELSIDIGTGDAASSAVLSGTIWGLAYNILALIDKIFIVEKPKVDVRPHFNEAIFSVVAQGIIVTKLVHIIQVALVLIFRYYKYNKQNKEEQANESNQ